MDFSLPHTHTPSVVTKSTIRYIDVPEKPYEELSLDEKLHTAANEAATDLFLVPGGDSKSINSLAYPERSTPQCETIQPGSLVVIFESFDNLKFCYAKTGEIFSNRNGHFHHDDFLGKPFGSKIRSRNNRGYGYVHLLKPTPELWARSLNHRTQIIHELDASMIVYYLNLRPNMVVCESGTGSGALSHGILRTIAPHGLLHTYEFNQLRADTARTEFAKNGLAHLVSVYHRDVCGKGGQPGGFDRPPCSVDAVVLDLPEPWDAVAHAEFCLKPNARLASYSPCVEQSQKTVAALTKYGFHSIKTREFRLKEYYVDEVEYELPPKAKRPKTADPRMRNPLAANPDGSSEPSEADAINTKYKDAAKEENKDYDGEDTGQKSDLEHPKGKIAARPFTMMRGHTAFLTFAVRNNSQHQEV